MKYITDIINMKKVGESKLLGACYSHAEKEMLLAYMNRFEPHLFTTEPVTDIFTGEKVADADNGFSDGEFTWYVSEIYYFRKYDLAVSEEFIDHVRQSLPI